MTRDALPEDVLRLIKPQQVRDMQSPKVGNACRPRTEKWRRSGIPMRHLIS